MIFLSELKNKNLSGKTCLLRVDFNIEDTDLSEKNLRIQAVLPTIKFLINKGAKVVILSHRGRPTKFPILKSQFPIYSLRPFVKILSKLLKRPIKFANFRTSDVQKLTLMLRTSDVLLLENLRFLTGEDKNDAGLAKKLAALGDFYVDDAFAFSHRKDASVVAITKFLPSYAGLLLENEIKNLSGVTKNPKKPLIIILGGAKVAEKIETIKSLLKKADKILIGGAITNDLIKKLSKSKNPRSRASSLRGKIILPIDYIKEKGKIMDIGPKTAQKYAEIIKNAKTIIWNGPMGYIENPKFSKGTEAIIKAIIKSRALAIIGGGETISSIFNFQFPISKKNIFLWTGGGAMLEFLAGKKLPGIAALDNSRASLAIGGKR